MEVGTVTVRIRKQDKEEILRFFGSGNEHRTFAEQFKHVLDAALHRMH